MRFAFDILKTKIPELNERALSEQDFEAISKREKVIVADAVIPKPFISAYVTFNNRHFILLDRNMKGVMRLFFAWYELSHYFLHAPRNFTHYWRWLGARKEQFEAESLPLMAMLPQPYLPAIMPEYDATCVFSRRVIEKRFYLLEHWKI